MSIRETYRRQRVFRAPRGLPRQRHCWELSQPDRGQQGAGEHRPIADADDADVLQSCRQWGTLKLMVRLFYGCFSVERRSSLRSRYIGAHTSRFVLTLPSRLPGLAPAALQRPQRSSAHTSSRARAPHGGLRRVDEAVFMPKTEPKKRSWSQSPRTPPSLVYTSMWPRSA